MKVIQVIPIVRGIAKDSLTYFTRTDPPVGSIVNADIRGRKVHGLVISSEDAVSHKADLKSSTFAVKKADPVPVANFLSPEFLRAAEETAKYYAGTFGGALHSLVPPIVLKNISDLAIKRDMSLSVNAAPSHDAAGNTGHAGHHGTKLSKSHVLALQADDEERFSHYKSIIREEFARGSSVFICVPSAADALRIKSQLDRGIGEYSYIFHSQQTKKMIVLAWNKIEAENHPILIIATGAFFCLPRQDLGTIIVERENSRGYKLQSRPFVDVRMFAEAFARQIGARMILGDTLLRTETVDRYRKDEIHELSPLKFRSMSGAEQIIADARNDSDDKGTHFQVISQKLYELIHATKENAEHTFLFASRRGLAPLTLCSDCGTIVLCHKCRSPIVLHSTSTERYFLCHHCGERRTAEEKCAKCTGWRLKSFGVGIELIAEELKKRFPEVTIFRIDSDTVKTHKKALAVAAKFKEKPGSVLIGTEMAIAYLDNQIENTGIVSIDSMFSMPDFRINEKMLSTILKVRSLAHKRFLIQTRNPDHRIFQYAIRGNLIDFYKEESDERERFDYPPFTTLIKITFTGTEKKVREEMGKLLEHFADYSLETYQAFTPWQKGKYTEHALIKIGRRRWVDEKLLELLRALPPQFIIEVDPESIL